MTSLMKEFNYGELNNINNNNNKIPPKKGIEARTGDGVINA